MNHFSAGFESYPDGRAGAGFYRMVLASSSCLELALRGDSPSGKPAPMRLCISGLSSCQGILWKRIEAFNWFKISSVDPLGSSRQAEHEQEEHLNGPSDFPGLCCGLCTNHRALPPKFGADNF